MKYRKGDVLWQVPIRYWEKQEPHRCVVSEDCEVSIGENGLLVEHEGYGHEVYILPDEAYYNKDTAFRMAHLKKEKDELRKRDFLRMHLDHHFADRKTAVK